MAKQVEGIQVHEDAEHSDKQLYSCGSLAPKLKRGGGCMDHGFSRHIEPWEYSDGCIYLVRELTNTHKKDLALNYLEQMAELGYIDSFKHSAGMKENLFKSLTMMLENIGKKKFRSFVEITLDPAFRNLKNEHQNCKVSAEDYLISLKKAYGDNIFKAIIEGHDPKFLPELDRLTMIENSIPKQDGFIYPNNSIPEGSGPMALMGAGAILAAKRSN